MIFTRIATLLVLPIATASPSGGAQMSKDQALASCGGCECNQICNDPSYLYNPKPLKWKAHEDYARSLGCHLASIHSDEENVKVYDAACASDKRVWLGGKPAKGAGDLPTDPNDWKWTDGSCWDYTNWLQTSPPQPSGSLEDQGRTCIEMLGTIDDGSKWNDVRCAKPANVLFPAVYKCCA